MCVVCLPGREEHGEYRDQSCESANLGRAVADCCRLEKTGQGAVERVNAMAISYQSGVLAHWASCHVLEELSQGARCAGAPRLLSVDVIHGRVPVGGLISAM
jgi:hypothetical protein